MPVRKHPSRNSVMETRDNRAVILFVTVCTEKRKPLLASPVVHGILRDVWRQASSWIVGRYVIMPDHLHFFCAPATWPPSRFHAWMHYWKRLFTQKYMERTFQNFAADAARGDTRPSKVWQSACWDRQLRTGESYSEKWEYVRNNPVRKGLCSRCEEWPYQGEQDVLAWHDR